MTCGPRLSRAQFVSVWVEPQLRTKGFRASGGDVVDDLIDGSSSPWCADAGPRRPDFSLTADDRWAHSWQGPRGSGWVFVLWRRGSTWDRDLAVPREGWAFKHVLLCFSGRIMFSSPNHLTMNAWCHCYQTQIYCRSAVKKNLSIAFLSGRGGSMARSIPPKLWKLL
jgi:hypothetical protein